MKKIILILDGMADRKQKVLGNKTPLEYAHTPNLDKLFNKSTAGCVQTIPEGQEAGSAVANLNLLGFESGKVYKGRAVIEAAGAGLDVDEDSLYVRCNFVSFKGKNYKESVIESYSAHDIETEQSAPLADRLNNELFTDGMKLYNTDSFRNILVVKGKTHHYPELTFSPPHDIIGQPITDYIFSGEANDIYFDLLEKAYQILNKDNKTKANGIWFWGASVAPSIKDNGDEKKIILSETTLMRGISALSGIECISTPEDKGFEKFLEDKLENSIKAINSDNDFIYLHIQKPDDLSHELQPLEKAQALSMIDEHYVGKLMERIDCEYSMAIASDHYTFSDTGAHGREAAPFIMIKSSDNSIKRDNGFTESNCIAENVNITPSELHKMF